MTELSTYCRLTADAYQSFVKWTRKQQPTQAEKQAKLSEVMALFEDHALEMKNKIASKQTAYEELETLIVDTDKRIAAVEAENEANKDSLEYQHQIAEKPLNRPLKEQEIEKAYLDELRVWKDAKEDQYDALFV